VVQKKQALTPATPAAIIKPTNAVSDGRWHAPDGMFNAKQHAP
jgi:hypothetical protein